MPATFQFPEPSVKAVGVRVITSDWRSVWVWPWSPDDEYGEAAALTTFTATADPGTVGEVRVVATSTGATTPAYAVSGPTGQVRNPWIDMGNGVDSQLILQVRRTLGTGSVRILEASVTFGPVVLAYAAPGFQVRPQISGVASPGSTLTVVAPTVTGYPTPTVTYEWSVAGVAVGTGSTLVVDGGWEGDPVVVTATASNQVGSASAVSDEVIVEEAETAGFGSSFGTSFGSS